MEYINIKIQNLNKKNTQRYNISIDRCWNFLACRTFLAEKVLRESKGSCHTVIG